MVQDDGALTRGFDWDGAEIEAFGVGMFGLYESFFGEMDNGVSRTMTSLLVMEVERAFVKSWKRFSGMYSRVLCRPR